jgi:phage-related protein
MEKELATERKIDAAELAKNLAKLPEEERKKIYYMIKGIELVNEPAAAGKERLGDVVGY